MADYGKGPFQIQTANPGAGDFPFFQALLHEQIRQHRHSQPFRYRPYDRLGTHALPGGNHFDLFNPKRLIEDLPARASPFPHDKIHSPELVDIDILPDRPRVIHGTDQNQRIVAIINNSDALEEVTVPVWQAEIPMRGRMRRLMYSYHEGYTTEYEEYIVEDGEIVVNMGAYSALVLKEMDVNYG